MQITKLLQLLLLSQLCSCRTSSRLSSLRSLSQLTQLVTAYAAVADYANVTALAAVAYQADCAAVKAYTDSMRIKISKFFRASSYVDRGRCLMQYIRLITILIYGWINEIFEEHVSLYLLKSIHQQSHKPPQIQSLFAVLTF